MRKLIFVLFLACLVASVNAAPIYCQHYPDFPNQWMCVDAPAGCAPLSDCNDLAPHVNQTVNWHIEWNTTCDLVNYYYIVDDNEYNTCDISGTHLVTSVDLTDYARPDIKFGYGFVGHPEWGYQNRSFPDWYGNTSEWSGPLPTASFACVPLSQYLDADVVCTDSSTVDTTSWYWTVVDFDGDLRFTSSTRNFSWQSHYPGLYSVNLRASNGAGSDWENKTNYVSILAIPTVTPTPVPTIPPGYIRSYVNVYDINYNQLNGANIYIKDVEAGTWKNTTSATNGIAYIDTLPYHTLNIYSDYTLHANQYYPAELLGADTGYAGDYHFALTLYPYAAAPGTGNVNLYVSIYDNTFKNPVPNVFVQISFPGNATLGAYTNDGGQQVFTVPNHTVMSVTATKPGWMGDVVTIDSGPGPTYSVAMGLDPAVVSPTITRTPVPGGTVPTTIAPGQNPDGSYQSGYANLQGQAMMNWLASNGMGLVQICFLVTIISLLGMAGGRKK